MLPAPPRTVRWIVAFVIFAAIVLTTVVSSPAQAGPTDPGAAGKAALTGQAGPTNKSGTATRMSHRRRAGSVAESGKPGPTRKPGTPAADPPTLNPDCSLILPEDTLSATGLATPFQLIATDPKAGPCREADPDQSAFVEATILDPATGALSVYRPLVVDRGRPPAAPTVVPTLPAGAVTGLWFGSNGDSLTLRGTGQGMNTAHCVNGDRNSVFGQYSYCNAPAFFAAANTAVAAHRLTIPPLGVGKDGQPCPTVRDFSVVDQDQSDNDDTSYRLLPDGATAQDTSAVAAALPRSTPLSNGSDNGLLDHFVDPALGCTPFTAPDLTNPGSRVPSLALNELQAAAGQGAPSALVPLNDPMTLDGDRQSPAKTNLYRAGVDQAALPAGQTPQAYCKDMMDIGTSRVLRDRALTGSAASPDPETANSLFTFLGSRLSGSFDELGCADLLHEANPVQVRMQGDVAVAVSFGGQGRAGR